MLSRRIVKSWGDPEPSILAKLRMRLRERPTLKAKVSRAIHRLRVQKTRLENASLKIERHDKALFDKCVKAQMVKDSARAVMYANECAELRRIAKTTLRCQLALEQVLLRLETIKDFGEVASLMGPVLNVVQEIKTELSGVMPEVSLELSEISDTLGDIVMEIGEAAGVSYDETYPSNEARKILDEANVVAEQKMKEKFPELPLQTSVTVRESPEADRLK